MPSEACASRDERQRRERDLLGQLRAQRGAAGRSSPRSRCAPLAAQRQTWRARNAGSPFAESVRAARGPPTYRGRRTECASPSTSPTPASPRAAPPRRSSPTAASPSTARSSRDPARDVDDTRAVKVDGKRGQRPAADERRSTSSTSPRASSRPPRTPSGRRTVVVARPARGAPVPGRPARHRHHRPDPADQRRRPRAPAHPPVVRGPAHLPRAGRQRAGQRAGAALAARRRRARGRPDRAREGPADPLRTTSRSRSTRAASGRSSACSRRSAIRVHSLERVAFGPLRARRRCSRASIAR